MDPGVFDAYRKVTVVRNPWDQEVSLYYWRTRNQHEPASFERFVQTARRQGERKNFDIYSIEGRLVADIVLKYERLADDFSDLPRIAWHRLGAPAAAREGGLPAGRAAGLPPCLRSGDP
jgi:hypothetical protein